MWHDPYPHRTRDGARVISVGIFLRLTEWSNLCSTDRAKIEKEIASVYKMLTQRDNITSIGIAGFCWGCYHVFKASGTDMVQAGVNFHPSISVAPMLYGYVDS